MEINTTIETDFPNAWIIIWAAIEKTCEEINATIINLNITQ